MESGLTEEFERFLSGSYLLAGERTGRWATSVAYQVQRHGHRTDGIERRRDDSRVERWVVTFGRWPLCDRLSQSCSLSDVREPMVSADRDVVRRLSRRARDAEVEGCAVGDGSRWRRAVRQEDVLLICSSICFFVLLRRSHDAHSICSLCEQLAIPHWSSVSLCTAFFLV